MPRTTRKSATVGPSLGELWSERELKAVLRTTRTVEKAKEVVNAEAAKVEATKAEAAKKEAAKEEAAEAAKVEAETASAALADQEEAAEAAKVEAETASAALADQEEAAEAAKVEAETASAALADQEEAAEAAKVEAETASAALADQEEAAEAAKVEAETASDALADQEVERLTQVDQPASRLEVAVPRAAHLSTAFGPVAEPLDEPIEHASPALEDSATEVAEGDIGYASSLENDANCETQHAVAAGGGPLLAAVVAAAEEVLRIRDDQRAENDQAKNEQSENDQTVNERPAENGMSGGGEEVQMVLYCSTMKVGGKRPVMHLYDAKEDPNQLSSLKVKKCAWVDNVPDALKGVMYTPNKALCALRGALDPTKASLGNAGINKNVSLAVNQEGKPILIKGLIQNKTLHTHLCG